MRLVVHSVVAPSHEQPQPGGERQQAGVVVTGRADLGRVVHGLDPGDDPEEAAQERERPAPPSAQARMGPGREREQGERDESADEVIAGGGPGLRLDEPVIDHVDRDDREREPERREARHHAGAG